ncbi:hypothetical protein F2Q68_00013716 [Brassica cretica]|uniref:Uncharacterized protein n=1 Tax=Brassica cretica TaxID=69181 RepID=A0A8S9HUL9_BRACR|nr:hypothetical protein F2Q68_00013716 [Brassica cretica]
METKEEKKILTEEELEQKKRRLSRHSLKWRGSHITIDGPVDPDSCLESRVESLIQNSNSEFSVIILQMHPDLMSLPLEDENKIISRMDHKGKRNVIDIYAAVELEAILKLPPRHYSGNQKRA